MPEAIPLTPGEQPWLDLVNSRWRDHTGSGQVHDRLPLAEWRAWFLRRWDFDLERPEPAPLELLASVRDACREIAEAWTRGRPLPAGALARLDSPLVRAAFTRRLEARWGRLRVETVPARRDWDWVIAEIANSVAGADPALVKECGNPDCSWLFYDTSRNRTRRWCEAATCGNLVKVRQFRNRARARG